MDIRQSCCKNKSIYNNHWRNRRVKCPYCPFNFVGRSRHYAYTKRRPQKNLVLGRRDRQWTFVLNHTKNTKKCPKRRSNQETFDGLVFLNKIVENFISLPFAFRILDLQQNALSKEQVRKNNKGSQWTVGLTPTSLYRGQLWLSVHWPR